MDKGELEVPETQVKTLVDQGLREARTPRRSLTRRAGQHLPPHRGKRSDEVSGIA